ncbi:MAG: hypothetical protein B6U94_07910 [Thermofilum sp. ex4484_79]|nr:MAG: hypothetical protein B6U94_07910 [Thermofilum sp. ex4484_79]
MKPIQFIIISIIIIFVIIVNRIKFYDREVELRKLESIKHPFLAVIYGRRRVGKTRLILE